MSEERPVIDNTLNKKSDAFDLVVDALTEAGFDTSNSTYPDIVALVRSLSVEGLEASAVRMTSEIVKRYEEVNKLHAAYMAEVVPLYTELRNLVSSFTEISKNVAMLMQEHKLKGSGRARKRENLVDFLDTCETLGRNPAAGALSTIALNGHAYNTLAGLSKMLQVMSNGKVIRE